MDKTNINALVQTITRSFKFNKQKTIFNGTIPILPEIFIASAMHMICTRMYNPLDRLRNLCQVQNRIKGSENFFPFISLRERFLTTGTSTVHVKCHEEIEYLSNTERESLERSRTSRRTIF